MQRIRSKLTMRSAFSSRSLLLLLLLLSFLLAPTKPDPDLLSDFCVADTSAPFFLPGAYPCLNPDHARPSHFATSALSRPGNPSSSPFGFDVTSTGPASLPGSNAQSLSLSLVSLAPRGGLLPLHSHPRASEVALVLRGDLVLAGFVDTGGRLFAQQLRPGDAFVFPRGLVHFAYNLDGEAPALVLSGMNSQSPGAQLLPMAAFRSAPGVPQEVLERTFRVPGQDIQRIQKNLGG